MSCLEQIKCCVDNTIYKLSININRRVAPDPDVKESRSETQPKSSASMVTSKTEPLRTVPEILYSHPSMCTITQTFDHGSAMLTVELLSTNVQVDLFKQWDSFSLSREKHMP